MGEMNEGFSEQLRCPKCRRTVQPGPEGMAGIFCFNCGPCFDDDGHDMDYDIESFQQELQSNYDAFVGKLIEQTLLHLDEEPADPSGFSLRQFIQRIDPRINADPMVQAMVMGLVSRTSAYQRRQRPRVEAVEVVDPTNPFGKLTQAFVIDFVSQCRQAVEMLTDQERQLLSAPRNRGESAREHLSAEPLEVTMVMLKLLKRSR